MLDYLKIILNLYKFLLKVHLLAYLKTIYITQIKFKNVYNIKNESGSL